MKLIAALCVMCAILAGIHASNLLDNPDNLVERKAASQRICMMGGEYALQYDTVGLHSKFFFNLDNLNIAEVRCTGNGYTVLVVFGSVNEAKNFASKLVAGESIVTSFGKYHSCGGRYKSDESGFLMRRVVEMEVSGNRVVLDTAHVAYTEVIADGRITLEPLSKSCETALGYNYDKHICLGMNSHDCASANQPFTIYQDQYITITCADCFIGFQADVFFDIEFGSKLVNSVQTGLKNINLDAALILDAVVTKQWGTGVDKIVNLINNLPILNFQLGPIPFHLWFNLPVEVTASATFLATAQADVGAQWDWAMGDMMVHWAKGDGWSYTGPTPVLNSKTYINGSVSFNGDIQFAIIPTPTLTVDNVISYTWTLTPELTATVEGSTTNMQICANVSYDVNLSYQSVLSLDILDDHQHDVFGPKTIWDSGNRAIAGTCVTEAGEEVQRRKRR